MLARNEPWPHAAGPCLEVRARSDSSPSATSGTFRRRLRKLPNVFGRYHSTQRRRKAPQERQTTTARAQRVAPMLEPQSEDEVLALIGQVEPGLARPRLGSSPSHGFSK